MFAAAFLLCFSNAMFSAQSMAKTPMVAATGDVFTCDDGCEIGMADINNDYCDCAECEDESNWSCETCGDCPGVCGEHIACVKAMDAAACEVLPQCAICLNGGSLTSAHGIELKIGVKRLLTTASANAEDTFELFLVANATSLTYIHLMHDTFDDYLYSDSCHFDLSALLDTRSSNETFEEFVDGEFYIYLHNNNLLGIVHNVCLGIKTTASGSDSDTCWLTAEETSEDLLGIDYRNSRNLIPFTALSESPFDYVSNASEYMISSNGAGDNTSFADAFNNCVADNVEWCVFTLRGHDSEDTAFVFGRTQMIDSTQLDSVPLVTIRGGYMTIDADFEDDIALDFTGTGYLFVENVHWKLNGSDIIAICSQWHVCLTDCSCDNAGRFALFQNFPHSSVILNNVNFTTVGFDQSLFQVFCVISS